MLVNEISLYYDARSKKNIKLTLHIVFSYVVPDVSDGPAVSIYICVLTSVRIPQHE